MKKKPQLKNLPHFLKKRWFWFIANLYRNSVLLPWFCDITHIWRHVGCHVGKDVRIGLDVYFDVDNASMITIEDDVWIASRALILCHRRDMHQYFKGERYKEVPYIIAPVTLKKGCQISMDAVIMPGVTIGEGAIVGISAVVTKDVPPYTIVTGIPAKVVRELKERPKDESDN